MMRGGGGAARRKHGDRASVITGLPEHPLGSIAACSARNKNAEDTVVSRCERFRLEQRARAIETTKISTLPPVRLDGRYIFKKSITTETSTPRVPVMLTSSRSCLGMTRTPRAHPGSRERNRHQPQPSFLEATRTGVRGRAGGGQQKRTRALSLVEHSHAALTRIFREAAEPIARPRRGLSH